MVGNPLPRRAFTLVEVVIAVSIFLMIMGGMYRLFFSRVRSIKMALEHVGVNESARKFLAVFGNDVRNANRVLQPIPIERKQITKLPFAKEGVVCSLESQVFDFTKKPPDERFLRKKTISWKLTARLISTGMKCRKFLPSRVPPSPLHQRGSSVRE